MINPRHMQMAHIGKVIIALSHIFIWLLLYTFEVSNASESEINCLRSIKESLEDPYNKLSSWDFNSMRNTEGFICKFVGVDCWHLDENKVLNLELSGMGLKGSFPQGIKNCSSLTGLDLSSNELSGPLPPDIATMLRFVTALDLSDNKFSGEIPMSIANCSYLNALKLDHNQLSGEIPRAIGLLSRIKTFSVSNNLLSGPVPQFSSSVVTADSYAHNSGLCGGPLKRCRKPKVHDIRHIIDLSFKNGFISGYVFSALVSVIVVLMAHYMPWVRVKKTQKNKKMLKGRTKKKIEEADRVGLLPNEKLLLEGSPEVSKLERMVTRMSLTEVSEATGNFSTNNVIGLGKIGMMYKAVLPNGWFLAVKRLYDSQQFEKQFLSELLALGRLRHNNLVPLLGFCIERKEKLLVYKYISNGNLYDWLHTREVGAKILEWSLRIKIAIGIAKGLAWLHHECNFRVVHLNLSSNCILLDQNFEPKISNFGGAIISNFGGVTFMNLKDSNSSQSNYVDSGVWELEFVKKDVYDFGIMLLELITGKEPIQMTSSSKSLDGSLVDWITHLLTSSSGLYDALDKCLTGRGFDGEIFQFLRIACSCVQPFPGQRPTMLEVYDKICMVGENYGLKNNMSDEIVEAEITQID